MLSVDDDAEPNPRAEPAIHTLARMSRIRRKREVAVSVGRAIYTTNLVSEEAGLDVERAAV
jgi:hypothetical protein